MGVNFLADKAASVENAIAVTQSIMTSDKAKIEGKETEPKRETHQAIVSDLADGKVKDLGLRVLRACVQNLAASGLEMTPDKLIKKTDHKVKDEYDMLFDSKHESSEDKVDIKNSIQVVQQAKNKYQQKEGQGRGDQNLPDQAMTASGRETAKEFIQTYSKFIVNGSNEFKKKVDELEGKLQEKGLSPKELLSLKASVKNSIRGELLSQIKESFVNRLFVNDKESMRFVLADRGIDEALNAATNNQRLGGEDFGGYKTGLENAIREMAVDTKAEIREYLAEEITSKFVEGELKGKIDDKGLNQLLELGEKVGLDGEAFVQNWKKLKDDLGLVPADIPNARTGFGANTDSDRRQKPAYEITSAEEKDILCNQLRAVYMQRAIKGDMITALQTSFKMRKLKNGLIKLGLNYEDFQRIENEGKEVAVGRFREMLEEVLAERATMYDLSGPAFSLIETKKRSILANLERLGVQVSEEELKILIEKTDIKMHDIAMDELISVRAVLKSGPNSAAEKKQGQLLKLIRRLRDEAKIVGPEIPGNHVSDRT